MNRDPIEENGGLNLYGFVGNDGVGEVDYLGYVTYVIPGGNDDFTSSKDIGEMTIELKSQSNCTMSADMKCSKEKGIIFSISLKYRPTSRDFLWLHQVGLLPDKWSPGKVIPAFETNYGVYARKKGECPQLADKDYSYSPIKHLNKGMAPNEGYIFPQQIELSSEIEIGNVCCCGGTLSGEAYIAAKFKPTNLNDPDFIDGSMHYKIKYDIEVVECGSITKSEISMISLRAARAHQGPGDIRIK
jgi:hypothetical protein